MITYYTCSKHINFHPNKISFQLSLSDM